MQLGCPDAIRQTFAQAQFNRLTTSFLEAQVGTSGSAFQAKASFRPRIGKPAALPPYPMPPPPPLPQFLRKHDNLIRGHPSLLKAVAPRQGTAVLISCYLSAEGLGMNSQETNSKLICAPVRVEATSPIGMASRSHGTSPAQLKLSYPCLFWFHGRHRGMASFSRVTLDCIFLDCEPLGNTTAYTILWTTLRSTQDLKVWFGDSAIDRTTQPDSPLALCPYENIWNEQPEDNSTRNAKQFSIILPTI